MTESTHTEMTQTPLSKETLLFTKRNELLQQFAIDRDPEIQKSLETIKDKTCIMFKKITGKEFQETNIIIPVQETYMLRNTLMKELHKNSTPSVLIETPNEGRAKSRTLNFKTNDGSSRPIAIGFDLQAKEGEITHELFHAYWERFTHQKSASTILAELSDHVFFQTKYDLYLDDRKYLSSTEQRFLDYAMKPNEIVGHILQEYIDFEDAQSQKKEYQPRVCKQYGSYGKEELVKTILTEFEQFAQTDLGNRDFGLPQKEQFIQPIKEPFSSIKHLAKESQIASAETRFINCQDVLFHTLQMNSPAELKNNPILIDEITNQIGKTMNEARVLGLKHEEKEIQSLFDFYSRMDQILQQNPAIAEALHIKGVQEMIFFIYDKDKQKTYSEPAEPMDTPEEFLQMWKDELKEIKTKQSDASEKPPSPPKKMSFNEFVKKQEEI